MASEVAASASTLRLLRGVEVAESCGDTAGLWLRGPDLTDEIDSALRRVPGLRRFRVVSGDLLAEPGARVPVARLPPLVWKAIARHFVPALPPASDAGDRPASVRIRLVESSAERAAAALLTDARAWETWCTDAAEIRLLRLRFAACADGRALVRGSPLPAIPRAVPLWEDAGVLVPCGHEPMPDIGGDALRHAFGVGDDDVALLTVEGSFEVIPALHFAAASRSAARLTARGLAGA